MTGRELIFASIRASLGVTGQEAPRKKVVADRIAGHPTGIVPERGQLPANERRALFLKMLTEASGSCDVVRSRDDVPGAIGNYLRQNNLPLAVRRGEDARLSALPWSREPMIDVSIGASDGRQLVSVSHALAGVAETGTLVLTSGRDNPTTLNFLPDHHIVVLDAADLAGDLETVFARLRETWGEGQLPRVVNMITGPSRSADIEQTLILGAHGPRRLHVVMVAAEAT
jgi:L-lactate dehydrogenase complex protein LldG